MRGYVRRLAAAVVLAAMVASALALPAFAAAYSISGTCRDDAQWYISTNIRTVGADNTTIRASFHNLCVKPMEFKLINANTGAQLGTTIVASTDVKNLATGVRKGTQFKNAYRLTSSCFSWQDRDFAGTEYY